LAVGAGRAATGKAPTLRVWQTATFKEAATFDVAPYVRSLAFASDGQTLAAGSGDGSVRFWDVNGWNEKLSWRAGTETLYSMNFARDDRTLITASKDGTATFWQLSQPLRSVAASNEVR